MRVEIDEQTVAATLMFGTIGWFLYENPQYQEPAVWIGGAIIVGWMAIAAVFMLSMLTELMLWDALWKYVRGESDAE